jgi:hypothetical protein
MIFIVELKEIQADFNCLKRKSQSRRPWKVDQALIASVEAKEGVETKIKSRTGEDLVASIIVKDFL